ncbi:MAG: RHS repeat-associated core domain-containing protein [Pseudomonas sp.]
MSKRLASTPCRYRYDPLDRMSDITAQAASPLQRFYRHGQLTTEVQGAEALQVFQSTEQLLAQREQDVGHSSTALLACDRQRSVLHKMNARAPQPVTYSVYGYARGIDPLGFNGQRPDPLTGLYILGNGYRAFSPALMRFIRPDSWSPFGKGGLNAYAYCRGDPVNHTDPTGHFMSFLLKALGVTGRNADTAVTQLAARTGDIGDTARLAQAAPAASKTLHDMPAEIIHEITSYLPHNSIESFAKTSKRFNALTKDASLRRYSKLQSSPIRASDYKGLSSKGPFTPTQWVAKRADDVRLGIAGPGILPQSANNLPMAFIYEFHPNLGYSTFGVRNGLWYSDLEMLRMEDPNFSHISD